MCFFQRVISTGKKELINYLSLASRPYFFTTAPLAVSNAAALESIKIIREDSERKNSLWKNIHYFKSLLSGADLNIGNAETAIFPIILGNFKRVIDITKIMGDNGVLANSIPYPAVPRKHGRVRMTVTAGMTTEHLDKGFEVLCNSIQEYEKRKEQVKQEEYGQLLAAV